MHNIFDNLSLKTINNYCFHPICHDISLSSRVSVKSDRMAWHKIFIFYSINILVFIRELVGAITY